ncbi:uncharacterized protein LOC115998895 [Ipomoea triloba]|uniref:uncharacterized protein LOC115998895 n=1 Tax=Ipomoea triloba TaxID=35885 RepID=UPI00125E2DF5|nr:uncharacterized protein LOC115998895 [Ipomoea triloba]
MHPWLSDANDPYVRTPRHSNHGNLTVSALADTVTNDWDVDILKDLFVPYDVELIMKLSVSSQFDNQWCWRGDFKGCYSVKHGYRSSSGLHEQHGNMSGVWKEIWHLKISPNIQYFLWRCFHGVLPTMAALSSRRVEVDGFYPLCRQHEETLKHLMCDCMQVSPFWNALLSNHIPIADEEFVTLLVAILAQGNAVFKLLFVVICWCVWRGRNDVVWNNKPWHFPKIQFEIASKPAMFTNTNRDLEYYGVIILDSDGGFIVAKNGPLRCLNDVHLAEVLAIKEVLSWVKDKGFSKILVYSNCQTVCNLLNGSSMDYSYAGYVINECKGYQRHYESVPFRFISRLVNKSAHAFS